jgi:hypothetical protein
VNACLIGCSLAYLARGAGEGATDGVNTTIDVDAPGHESFTAADLSLTAYMGQRERDAFYCWYTGPTTLRSRLADESGRRTAARPARRARVFA